MRHFGLLILLLCSCKVVAEQPNWYSESQRTANFPKGRYFTGIAYGEVHANEENGSAMERVKAAARVDALSTISIHVQNETNSHLRDESFESVNAWSEEITETFDSRTQTKVNIENLPGLEADAYIMPNSNEVIAFAYIEKRILCRQMRKQITVGLTRIETILENTEQLITNSQKLQARESLYKAPAVFDEVEQAQRILIAVDSYADEEDLQLNDSKQLAKRYINLSSALKNSINIFIECNSDMFGERDQTLVEQIKKELSKNGCSFVNIIAQADWVIRLKVLATLDVTSNYSDYDFVTLNVSGSVYDTKKQSSHEFLESDHASARKDRGGCRFAVNLMLRKETIAKSTASDIIEILKSK